MQNLKKQATKPTASNAVPFSQLKAPLPSNQLKTLPNTVKKSPLKDSLESTRTIIGPNAVTHSPSKASVQLNRLKSNISTNPSSKTSIPIRSSSNLTELFRHKDPNSEGSPTKAKNKFTQPRMNRMTELRLKHLQKSQANETIEDIAIKDPCKAKRLTARLPKVPESSEVGDFNVPINPVPTAPPLPSEFESLLNKLADVQSQFTEKVNNLRLEGRNISYKLISMVHGENCQWILKRDDLDVPAKNIPVQSMNFVKSRFREALYKIFEKMLSNVDTSKLSSDEMRSMLELEADKELKILNEELEKLNTTETTTDESPLLEQNPELHTTVDDLKSTNTHLNMAIGVMQKSKEELKKHLKELQKNNAKMDLKLAARNTTFMEQTIAVDKVRNEIQQLKKEKMLIQQRLKDSEKKRDQSQISSTAKINKLETRLKLALIDQESAKKKSEDLTNSLSAKDKNLAMSQKRVKDLEQLQDAQKKEQLTSHEADKLQISQLQAELAANQNQIDSMVKQEQMLREELEQMKDLITKTEKKVKRLEEEIAVHQQALATRNNTINSLDREMREKEQEANQKLNEQISKVVNNNTIITQINHELDSKNEQFQNLCVTMSRKQKKLHDQEHTIQLLEDSNARSVKLHTQLSEKNALLKDELRYLRRTVRMYVNILIGNNGKNMFEPVAFKEKKDRK